MDLISPSIDTIKELIAHLNKESKTSDVLKRQVLRELQNNLNIFYNAELNSVSADVLVDMLSNEAIKEAIKGNFKFKKLKAGTIEPYHVGDDRNKKYIGWTAEKLIDKIDEKTEELKNIKKMNNGTVATAKNNTNLMLSNLYFRMKLLAAFIKGPK